jgi:hypothetical protein
MTTTTAAPPAFLGIFIAFLVTKGTVSFMSGQFLMYSELFLAPAFFVLALGFQCLKEP